MATPIDQWEPGDLTADDDAPDSMRLKVLRRIVALSEADFGVWLTVHEVDDHLYYSPMLCEGDTHAPQMWRYVAGKPAAEPIQRGVRRPTIEERTKFQPVARRALLEGIDDPIAYSACRYFYEPHGVGDEARLLVFRGRKFIGWIGVFRWKDRPGFAPEELSRLDKTIDWVKAGLTAADHLQCEGDQYQGDDPEAMYLVVTPEAKIAYASVQARSWLTAQRVEDLRDLIRRFRRDGPGPLVVFHGMELRITLMDGPGGYLHYLIHLVSALVPAMAPDSLLTPTQRTVAEFAVHGATVNEIARTMERSPNTIKYHLKNIYERLGVSCRVELAAALATP